MKPSIPVYAIENLKSYRNHGILVSRFGHYVQEHEHLHAAHRHSFYHLVFFTDGTGDQQIDFKKFPVSKGLIYFMVPGQVHSWNFKAQPEGYIINFSADYFINFLTKKDYLDKFSFFNGQPSDQVIELSLDMQEKIARIFEDILAEGQHKVSADDDLVRTLLLRLFIEVSRATVAQKPLSSSSYNHTLLKNFQKLIATNYTHLRLPKQYAALLYITPNHLNALCNDFLGVSAGKLIRDRVVLEAKRLLINVDLRISEIAEQLNFADQSYFIRFFKKYEGTTPEKFRKKNTINHG